VALALALLACSMMLIQNLSYAAAIDPGFDTQMDALLFTGSFRALQGTTGTAALQEAAERLKGVAGIRNVTYARRLFLSGSGGGAALTVAIPGIDLPGGSVRMKYDQVGPNYFSMMNVRLLAGRSLDERDNRPSASSVVVNDYLAGQYWPQGDALGKILEVSNRQLQIVGIVANPKVNELSESPEPVLILPYAAWPSGDFTLIIETAGPTETLSSNIGSQLQQIAGERFSVGTPKTMTAFMLEVLENERRLEYVGSRLGFVGIALAALGLYSTMSWLARRRAREFGIRMAVGGSYMHVFGLVEKQALRVAAIGIPIGLLIAAAAMRALSSMVYGVQPGDPVRLIEAGVVVCLVVVAAGYPSARRAARTDPLEILRYE
jgi:hypothetical protein